MSLEYVDQGDYERPEYRKQGPVELEQQISPQFAFDNASIRAAFVRKVFAIVTVMILVNIVIVTPVIINDDVRFYMETNSWVYWIALLVLIYFNVSLGMIFFGSYLSLVCCQSVARHFPANIVILGIFTVACGIMLMVLCSKVPPLTVLLALTTTTLSSVAIILFASQTKYDITSLIFVVFAATVAVFIFALILAIMSFFIHIEMLHIIFSAAVCVLFMIWLAVDTQMIVGGKRYQISPEDYVFAALMLFIDIYEIFITLLSLFNSNN